MWFARGPKHCPLVRLVIEIVIIVIIIILVINNKSLPLTFKIHGYNSVEF